MEIPVVIEGPQEADLVNIMVGLHPYQFAREITLIMIHAHLYLVNDVFQETRNTQQRTVLQ